MCEANKGFIAVVSKHEDLWRKKTEKERENWFRRTNKKKKKKKGKTRSLRGYDQTKIKRGMFALLAQSGIKLTPEMKESTGVCQRRRGTWRRRMRVSPHNKNK